MKEVKLKKPLTIDGEKVTKLKLREPTAQDMIQLEDSLNQNARMLRLTEMIADVAPGDLHQMSARDFMACSAEVNSFLG